VRLKDVSEILASVGRVSAKLQGVLPAYRKSDCLISELWQNTPMKKIVFIAMALGVWSCQGQEKKTGGQVERDEWPIARGGAGLSGQVGVALPGKPGIKWMFKTEGAIVGEAVVSRDVVVFGNSAGLLTAVELKTGEKKWQKEFEQSFEAAPAIHGNTIYIGCEDMKLYALDLMSGDEKWAIETEDKITAGVNITKSPDGKETWIVMNGYDGVCRALNAKDGKEIWKHETEQPINGTPAVVDGKWVVFGGCDHYLYTLSLADGKATEKIEGEAPIVSTVGTDGSFVAWGDHSNKVMGADLTKGQLNWDYSDRNFPFMAAPAVDAKNVYIGGRDKKIHAISRASGDAVWKFKTGGRVESSPIVFTNGLVCGSSDGRIYALDLEKGEEVWKVDLGEAVVAAPSYAKGVILIGSEDGTLFALGEK
jgi:outer membrane protein assembly factor BamB